MFFVPLGVLLVMKALEDEWYIVIKPVFEILRDFFCISIYCVSTLSLHIESIDSMIPKCTISLSNFKPGKYVFKTQSKLVQQDLTFHFT